MSLEHIYRNSKTANIQIKPAFKSKGQLRSGLKHNERIGKEADKENIDKRRTYLNKHILQTNIDEIYLNLVNSITGKEYTNENVPQKEDIILEDGKKLRNDAVLAFEIETSYPGDMVWSMFDKDNKIVPVPDNVEITPDNVKDFFKMPLDKKEFEEWKDATVEFLKDKYGENIVSCELHMDEDEPHIHAIGVPIYKNDRGHNRLSCHEFTGGPAGLAKLQTEYSDYISYLGYKRGQEFSSRISNISTKEYKARLNMALSEKMPETIEECREEIRNLRAQNFDLKREMEQTMSSAKTIQKQRIKNEELRKENQKLKEHAEDLKKINQIQLRTLQINKDRAEAESIGKEVFVYKYPEQSDIVKNFDAARDEFINMGAERMREEGRTVILSYLDDLDHNGINDRYETIDLNHNGADDRSERDFK